MTRFKKYLKLYQVRFKNIWVWLRFYIGSRKLIMASGPNQSNELSVTWCLMMKAYLLILFKMFRRTNCTISVFQMFGTRIMHSYTPLKYVSSCYNIFISFCIKFKHFFQWSLTGIAFIWHEKYYSSFPIEAIPSLCIQEYLQIKPTGVSVWCIYFNYLCSCKQSLI